LKHPFSWPVGGTIKVEGTTHLVHGRRCVNEMPSDDTGEIQIPIRFLSEEKADKKELSKMCRKAWNFDWEAEPVEVSSQWEG